MNFFFLKYQLNPNKGVVFVVEEARKIQHVSVGTALNGAQCILNTQGTEIKALVIYPQPSRPLCFVQSPFILLGFIAYKHHLHQSYQVP